MRNVMVGLKAARGFSTVGGGQRRSGVGESFAEEDEQGGAAQE
jgi:hypothetical protein